jgi:hypothetical protein
MACIYKINGKTFNTTEEIQNYVSSDEFVSVLAKGNSGISKEVRNLILNKYEKSNNEVREIENGQGQTKNEGIKSKGKNDGQKTNDVQNEEVTEGGVKAPQVTEGVEANAVKPTEEQILQDFKDKNFVTFTYNNESEVPEQFKDKISSKGETNGKTFVNVTLPKSVADYELAKSNQTTNTKENAIQKPSTNEEVSRNGETRKNQPESSQGVRQGEQEQEATPQVKEANVKAIEEAITKKSGTIKNEIIKEAANPTEVKKILDNLDAIKSKLAGFKTKDGDRIFSEECKWG